MSTVPLMGSKLCQQLLWACLGVGLALYGESRRRVAGGQPLRGQGGKQCKAGRGAGGGTQLQQLLCGVYKVHGAV